MSLHAFGTGSTCYSTIWRKNIKKFRSQINSNTHVTTPNSPLISDTYIIGASQVGIEGIFSLSIKNTMSIDPLNGTKHNEPS